MVTIKCKGDYAKTNSFLEKALEVGKFGKLDQLGKKGVEALRKSTPMDSGETSNDWSYEIVRKNGRTEINFLNSNNIKGVNIAIILQYGHGTRNGGWVEGRDYINTAMQPLFDDMVDTAWKEVTNS